MTIKTNSSHIAIRDTNIEVCKALHDLVAHEVLPDLGMTAMTFWALLEEVTWDNEKITSIDWRTYRPLYLGAGIPEIETVLIHQMEGEAMGVGETAVTVVAGAIANAVFDATGARMRQVPFTPKRVRAVLEERF